MNFGDGKVFFFDGSNDTRFDVRAATTDANYPRGTFDNWRGFLFNQIVAAMEYEDCQGSRLLLTSALWLLYEKAP